MSGGDESKHKQALEHTDVTAGIFEGGRMTLRNRSGPGSHELRDGDRSGLYDEVYRRYVQYQVRRRDPWRKIRTPGDIPGNSNDYDEMHHLVGKKPRCTITFTLLIHTLLFDS